MTDLKHGTVCERSALYLVINAIPCSLHLENRVGLKLFTRLLRIGLDRARLGDLPGCDSRSEGGRLKQFIAQVEDAICNKIVGSPDRPISWKCPFDLEQGTIGTITMDNMRTRKVIANFDVMIELCVPDDDQPDWMEAICLYQSSILSIRKHADLTDAEIHEFQWSVDQFAQVWVKINNGKEGITNYIHLMIAGHLSDYLFKWRNLSVHSQQGWEALNLAVKKFFFRRTNCGGGRGSRNSLLPVARWLARRLV